MAKYLTYLLLAVSMAGCFTTAGGLVGHSVTSSREVRQPDGTMKTEQVPNTKTGLAVGAVLDVALVVVAVLAISSIPDEAVGRVGDDALAGRPLLPVSVR